MAARRRVSVSVKKKGLGETHPSQGTYARGHTLGHTRGAEEKEGMEKGGSSVVPGPAPGREPGQTEPSQALVGRAGVAAQ